MKKKNRANRPSEAGGRRKLRCSRYAVFAPDGAYLGIVVAAEAHRLLDHDDRATVWERPGTPTIKLTDRDAWTLINRVFTPGNYLPDDYCDPEKIAGRTVWQQRKPSMVPVPFLHKGRLSIAPGATPEELRQRKELEAELKRAGLDETPPPPPDSELRRAA